MSRCLSGSGALTATDLCIRLFRCAIVVSNGMLGKTIRPPGISGDGDNTFSAIVSGVGGEVILRDTDDGVNRVIAVDIKSIRCPIERSSRRMLP